MATAKKSKKVLIPAPQISKERFNREVSGEQKNICALNPAFNKNNVAVCIVSSNEYAPFAAVVLTSIVFNASKKNNYDLVVISDDMVLENVWRLRAIAHGHDNVSIRVLDVSDVVKGFSFYTWAHFTSKTYYRLLTPDIFSSYDKVIYLDSDTVVEHDIAQLYAIDLGDYLLGNAYDTHVVSYCTRNPPLEQREYNVRVLGMEKPEEYFQMGVTLYNVQRIREEYGEGYFIKQGANLKLRWLDQDVMNKLCAGRIKRIPLKWNVMVADMQDFIDEYYLPKELRREYFEARQDPYIVHYIGRSMPCFAKKNDLFEHFWKYARMSVFYEMLLSSGIESHIASSPQYIQLIRYIEELQAAVAAKRRILPIQTIKLKVKRCIRSVVECLLPKGTRRRQIISSIYQRIKGK